MTRPWPRPLRRPSRPDRTSSSVSSRHASSRRCASRPSCSPPRPRFCRRRRQFPRSPCPRSRRRPPLAPSGSRTDASGPKRIVASSASTRPRRPPDPSFVRRPRVLYTSRSFSLLLLTPRTLSGLRARGRSSLALPRAVLFSRSFGPLTSCIDNVRSRWGCWGGCCCGQLLDRLLVSFARHELDVGEEVVGDEEVDRVREIADALRDVARKKLRPRQSEQARGYAHLREQLAAGTSEGMARGRTRRRCPCSGWTTTILGPAEVRKCTRCAARAGARTMPVGTDVGRRRSGGGLSVGCGRCGRGWLRVAVVVGRRGR